MIVDGVDDEEIPLPNVKGDVLAKVIEFCAHYITEPMTEFEKVIFAYWKLLLQPLIKVICSP